jgi:hypothetical protein
MSLLRAEWTKLWSVRRWVLALAAAAVLTVGLSMLAASGSSTNVNEHPETLTVYDGELVIDEFTFANQTLTGDGSIVARVASQDDTHEWAGAGVMIKESLTAGSRYASIFLTPKHGVQMQANFGPNTQGSTRTGPLWLKLTRAGNTVTGYESADGTHWTEVGKATVALPATAHIGFFVSSPPKIEVRREAGTTSVGGRGTMGNATFDNVKATPGTENWESKVFALDLGGKSERPQGGLSESDGVYKLSGSGKIGPNPTDDDTTQGALFGILAGIIALAAVGVLFVTAEYKRGMIRTTFTVTPNRGQVLAAKAVVLGVTAFAISLVACVAALLLTRPLQRKNGFTAPAFPDHSIFEGDILRAVLLTSAFAACIALFGLGLGAILRHSAAAISTVIALVVLPSIISALLPLKPAQWLITLTPAAGFATQRAKPPTDTLVEAWASIGPWTAIAIVSAYAAAALGGAWLVQRRRDV